VCGRATLDLKRRHVSDELASLHDVQVRQLREKDAELRKLKKAELQLKVARDGLRLVEREYEKKEADVSRRSLYPVTVSRPVLRDDQTIFTDYTGLFLYFSCSSISI